MNTTTFTKQRLIQSLTGLAAASLIAMAPVVGAAENTNNPGYTPTGNNQATVPSDRTNPNNTMTNQEDRATSDTTMTQSERDDAGVANTDSEEYNQRQNPNVNSDSDGLNQREDRDYMTDRESYTKGENRNANSDTQTDRAIGANSGRELSSISPDELEDREVVNQNGEELGDVQEVVTSPDGSVNGVVISIGGVMGMGAKDIFASSEELQVEDDRLVWQTPLDKDTLSKRREYRDASAE